MTYLKIIKMLTHSTAICQIPTMFQSLFLGLRCRSEKKKKTERKKKRISELEGENSKHLK